MAEDKRLEQSKKFNDELSKTESLLDNLDSSISTKLKNGLENAIKQANLLNVEFGAGIDISKKLLSEQIKLSAKIEELERKRKKARTANAIEQLTYQIKIYERLQAQLVKTEAIIEEEKRLTEEKKKQNSVSGFLKNKLEDINKEYFSTLGILKLIINGALRYNKVSVDISKNFGYGAEQANRVASSLKDIAQSSNNANITLKSLGEAMNDLNTATGGVAEYSKDTLETQVMLTKQFGLTGEEAAGIYKFSVLTGKASSQVNKEMAATFANTRNSVKGSANFKATMAEAVKVSGQLAANLKNSPTLITKAIVQAQILGTTLEQTKNQGEALLNFESSLENELKAELLTGQQMNLERARAFALQGDMVGVMKELNNQGMTLEKFNNMNVIAQKSYAEALGLSADALSDQLRKQKIAQEQGKSLAEITAEEAVEAEKRQAIQEKFSVAIEKLQDLLGNLVAGPLGQFLDIITSILSNTIILSGILGGILFVNVLKLVKAFKSGAIIAIIENAMKTFSGIPFAGFALATAAAAGGIALLNSKTADDMVQPGYGKRTILSPEGAIKLNDNDTVIAGTNLGGGKGESISPSIDLSPMIAAINQVKASIDRLHAKDTTINMDGKQVGTTLTQGSYKVA